MKLFKKLKGKKGFSLAELLAVVGILAILIAVAAPKTAAYVKTIKLTELDDSARSIYMAAQNRLDSLKAKGTDLDFANSTKTAFSNRYTDSLDPSKAVELSYIFTAPNDGFMGIENVSMIESELDSNYYVIEYDSATGIVYGVFYSESADLQYIYETVVGPDNMNTEFSGRLAYEYNGKSVLIGYYGGDAYQAPVSNPDVADFSVDLFNAEKMGIHITAGSFEKKPGESEAKAYFTVSISDGISSPVNIIPEDTCYLGPGETTTIILDTLTSKNQPIGGTMSNQVIEKSFADWVGDKIPLGANIEITVTFYDKDKISKPKSISKSTNSLFAKDSTDTVALIEYGRHLQNLNNTTLDIATVNISRDIDFSRTDGNYEGWSGTYPGRKFYAVTRTDKITAVKGNDKTISYADVDGAGLFAVLSNANVEKLKIVNEKVNSTANAGALVGTMDGGSITNVEVYVEGDFGPSINPLNDPHATYVVKGSSNVGGLVGEAKNGTTISNSYAAVRVDGGNAGGLIGSANGITIENVYSGGHTKDGKYEYDDTKDPLINVSGTSAAGGIVGRVAGTVTVKGTVYSTCSVKGGAGSDTAFGGGNPTIVSGAFCYAVGYDYSTGTAVKASSRAGVKSAADEDVSGNVGSRSYDTALEKNNYPYKGLTVHRGDWINDDEPAAVSLGFFYWENEKGVYKFHEFYTKYVEDESGNVSINSDNRTTLCTDEDAQEISEYGYGYYFIGDVEVDGSDFVLADDASDAARDAAFSYIFGGSFEGEYTLVIGKGYTADNKTDKGDDTFTFTVKSDSKTYSFLYNPDFYAIAKDATSFSQYEVRNVAQLQHIEKYLSGTFKQSHDIVGNGDAHRPIGESESKAFTGVYNGQSYRIIDLTFDTNNKQYIGIFGVAKGAKFENIILFAPVSGNGSNAGGKTITVSGNNDVYAGGIVGYAILGPAKISMPSSSPITSLSAGTETGLKVSSLGLSGGNAQVVNAFNVTYAKNTTLGANAGLSVKALSANGEHVHHYPEHDAYSHKGQCTICGNVNYYEPHVYEQGSMQCKYCDYVHTHASYSVSKNSSFHWYECWMCGEIYGKEGHIPNNDNPTPGTSYNCKVCSEWFQYTGCAVHNPSSDWETDGTNHWHKCVDCGTIIDSTSHTFSIYKDNGNGTHTATCSVCKKTVTTGHGAQGSSSYYDENQHKDICACGYEMFAPHTASGWITDKSATAEENGQRHKECTACGYVMQTETIPAGRQPNDCIYCGSSNTRKMGPWNDEGHEMECNDCHKRFYAEHTINLEKSDGAAAPDLEMLGAYDSRLGRIVTIEDVKEVLKTVHYHYCKYCDYKEPLPLTFNDIRVDSQGDTNHRFVCLFCGQSVMMQRHELREFRDDYSPCDFCNGTYKDKEPDLDTSRGGIINCAVAGYTFVDSTTGGHTSNIGGIAGSNDVPIIKCEAVVDIERSNTDPGNGSTSNYGGIAGHADGSIDNCYSGGKVKMNKAFTTNNIAVIAGHADSTVTNCYSYLEVGSLPGGSTRNDNGYGSGDRPTGSSRAYVTSATTENPTSYKYSPKIYDAKVGETDHEHYGYFK